MISLILDILQLDEMYGVSENIDIAKGKNKMPQNLKDGWDQRKRKRAWQTL